MIGDFPSNHSLYLYSPSTSVSIGDPASDGNRTYHVCFDKLLADLMIEYALMATNTDFLPTSNDDSA